jgi:Ca2+-binding EF-hand superfamily protein
MVEQRVRAKCGSAGTSLLAAMLLSACSTVSNPFSNTNDDDRVFIAAAQTWDLNKDGTVTCDEWKQYVTTAVREADANGDGALDATEWQTLVKGDRLFEVASLSYYDSNGDGKATAEEIADKPNRAFALLDKNKDCQIDRNETVQVINVDKPKAKEYNQDIPKTGGGGR